MAVKDFIASVNLKSESNTLVNNSINGKTYVANFGNPYYSFTVESVPMTRQQFYDNFQDFITTQSNSKVSKNLLPILGNTTNQIAFGESYLGTFGNFSAGDTTVDVIGFITGVDPLNDYVSGQFKAGDLINFENHSKIYMVTEDVSIGSLSASQVKIFPALLEDLPTNSVVTNQDVKAQVISTSDTIEYVTGVDGYYTFQQDFREVR